MAKRDDEAMRKALEVAQNGRSAKLRDLLWSSRVIYTWVGHPPKTLFDTASELAHSEQHTQYYRDLAAMNLTIVQARSMRAVTWALVAVTLLLVVATFMLVWATLQFAR